MPNVNQGAERVLLVDDNLTNLKVLYEALEQEGYELLVAQSGEQALEITRQAQPSVILLDINMPGIDGYETCRRLKEDPVTSESVVVFLSARGEVEDKLKGFELGAVDYIGKPFHFEEVVARVKKHLQTYHRQRDLEREKGELEARLAEGFREIAEADLEALIAEGESEKVEFKSTLRWNLHTGKPDKRMENACLKTVAAYLNSEGGVLLVGVQDDGAVLGMETDSFPNEDKLLLHWNNLVRTHIGGEFGGFIRSSLESVSDKRILVVQGLRSPQPAFFRRDNDEFFYVRSGPSTNALSPSQVLAYQEQRKK